jgi:hypothetical protein
MTWKYYPNKQPTEVIVKTNHLGNWWTNDINGIGVYLTPASVIQLAKPFMNAFKNVKPFAFFFDKELRSKWRWIQSNNRKPDLYISEYAENVFCNFDIKKINNLATNSINTYYDWEKIPEQLKRFILNDTNKS